MKKITNNLIVTADASTPITSSFFSNSKAIERRNLVNSSSYKKILPDYQWVT